MNIRYYVTKHCHLLLNQNKVYVPILSTKHRKEVFLGTYVIQYQDIFNNILSITRYNGLFKVFFWNLLVQRIVYHYFGEFNLNNQAILSNNFILLTSDILAHRGSISENFANKLLFLQACLIYSETTTTI